MDRRIDTVCVTLHCTERPRDLIEKIQVWPPSSLLLQPCRYSAIEQVSVTSPTACVLIECWIGLDWMKLLGVLVLIVRFFSS